MEICVASPRSKKSKLKNVANKDEILRFLQRQTADLIVLPGYDSGHTPTPLEIQRVLKRGVHVFLQTGPGKTSQKMRSIPCIVSKYTYKSMDKQCFWHAPSALDMSNLAAAWPSRNIRIKSRTFAFLICGEINGFNKDGSIKNNRKLHFDILINPTHTVMGRWQHLGIKLANLSKSGICVHVANNNRIGNSITTDLRVYKNRKLISRITKQDVNIKYFTFTA